MTYSATKFEVTTSNGLGGGTFTRNLTDGQPTDFGTKFFLKKKASIMKRNVKEIPQTILHHFQVCANLLKKSTKTGINGSI